MPSQIIWTVLLISKWRLKIDCPWEKNDVIIHHILNAKWNYALTEKKIEISHIKSNDINSLKHLRILKHDKESEFNN